MFSPVARRAAGVAVILASLCAAALAGHRAAHLGVDEQRVPQTLIAALAFSEQPRSLLVDYNLSSIPQTLAPDTTLRVSIDGRADLFGPDLLADYARLQRAETGWETILAERYAAATDALLVERSGLARALRDRGWTVAGREAGLDAFGHQVTWVWLTTPARASERHPR